MAARTRRLTFAAPFVTTVLLASGCAGSDKPPLDNPQRNELPPPPDAAPPEADPEEVGAYPEGAGTWARDEDRYKFTYADGSAQIWFADSGTCVLVPDANCGGNDHDETPVARSCNPPPPARAVTCPPGLPADATKK